MNEDAHLRSACFASLDVLCAEFGDDVPYVGGLDRRIPYAGRRVPFLSTQKGIFRAAAQEGPAALSVQTSWKSPYGDKELDDGFLYAYRDGDVDQPDNRALRAAFTLNVPIVYFWSTRPGRYKPIYPCYVTADDPGARQVLLSPGLMAGPMDEPAPVPLEDPLERRARSREAKRQHRSDTRERAIVVALGGFTPQAAKWSPTYQWFLLVGPGELVELVLAHYEALPEEHRENLPLRRIYAPNVPGGAVV